MKNILPLKYKKPILIAGSVLIAGIVIYILAKGRKSNLVPGITGPVSPSISPTTSQPPYRQPQDVVVSFPIKKKPGSQTSPEEQAIIRNIQIYLNSKIDNYVEQRLVIDGFYGERTEAMAQKILGVKTISYSLYQEILKKI